MGKRHILTLVQEAKINVVHMRQITSREIVQALKRHYLTIFAHLRRKVKKKRNADEGIPLLLSGRKKEFYIGIHLQNEGLKKMC